MTRRLLLGSIAVIGAVAGFVLGMFLEFLLLWPFGYTDAASVFTLAIIASAACAFGAIRGGHRLAQRIEGIWRWRLAAALACAAMLAALAGFIDFVG